MKQQVLGSLIGELALSFRDKFDILHAAYFNSDCVGTLANDQLAERLVTSICQPYKTFLDIGAHIGSIVSRVAYNDSSIKIVAVEAIPEKVAKLRKKFPSVEIHSCVVGEYTGEVSFYVNLSRSGYSSLGKVNKMADDKVSEITVPIKRLDEIVSSHEIDVIKIDVEGAELGVLRGSVKILNNSRPTIMFESGPQKEDNLGYTKQDLYGFLSSNDYVLLIPNRVAHDDCGLSVDEFLESHVYPRRTTNYFAIPKERRVEIRDRARHVLRVSTP